VAARIAPVEVDRHIPQPDLADEIQFDDKGALVQRASSFAAGSGLPERAVAVCVRMLTLLPLRHWLFGRPFDNHTGQRDRMTPAGDDPPRSIKPVLD
jgi:hypothetical protein